MSRFAQTEQDRRLSNIVQMGVVEQVDYSNPARVRVRIGELLTGWLRMGSPRAGDAHQSWGYSIGEEVVVVAPSGDLAQGVIVCALANGSNAGQAAPGSCKTVYPGGVVIEIVEGSIRITAPGNVIVNGDVIADGISLKTHVHGEVVPGPADTGVPK